MGDKSAIGWTDASWNPTTGCDRTSPGCDNCYALTMAARLKLMGSARYQVDGDEKTSGPGFGLTEHPDALDIPLRWKRPRMIFVNSMSDLFHPKVSDEFIHAVISVMNAANWHTYQVLTKRPQRMAKVLRRIWWDCNDDVQMSRWTADELALGGSQASRYDVAARLPQTQWGTSIENDPYTFRANHLRATPAALRFLSLEPLIGPLPSLNLDGIGWVIVGAESGHGARPMDMDWVRPIRDACVERGIPLYLKQDATPSGHKILLPELDGQVWDQMPGKPS